MVNDNLPMVIYHVIIFINFTFHLLYEKNLLNTKLRTIETKILMFLTTRGRLLYK